MPTNYSTIKCIITFFNEYTILSFEPAGSLVLTMVYFSLYLNLITEFIRILDCYIAIVFPFSHQQYITQVGHFVDTKTNGEEVLSYKWPRLKLKLSRHRPDHCGHRWLLCNLESNINSIQENSLAMGACCWFIGLALSAGFYFTGLSRSI